MTALNLTDKPIPSLAEWLGDGVRADGFESWVRITLAAEELADMSDGERASLRMLRTFLVAMVEVGRIETERHGRTYHDTAAMMARVAGGAVMAAIMSITRDDAGPSLPRLARLLAEEFRQGEKAMIEASR